MPDQYECPRCGELISLGTAHQLAAGQGWGYDNLLSRHDCHGRPSAETIRRIIREELERAKHAG